MTPGLSRGDYHLPDPLPRFLYKGGRDDEVEGLDDGWAIYKNP